MRKSRAYFVIWVLILLVACKEDNLSLSDNSVKCNHLIFIGLDGWGGAI